MTINRTRPVENLIGDNRGMIRMKLGNIHCMSSVLTAARHCRPKNMRRVPVALRRGWAKCVIETLAEYQGTYRFVMTGGKT